MGKTGQGCCGVVADPAPMDSGYDCVMIPAPSSALLPAMKMIKAVNICGRGKPIEIFCISAHYPVSADKQKISIGLPLPHMLISISVCTVKK